MPKKDREGPTQATDAFEFIGRMAQKRKEKPELEEKEAVEKSETQEPCFPKSEQ